MMSFSVTNKKFAITLEAFNFGQVFLRLWNFGYLLFCFWYVISAPANPDTVRSKSHKMRNHIQKKRIQTMKCNTNRNYILKNPLL